MHAQQPHDARRHLSVQLETKAQRLVHNKMNHLGNAPKLHFVPGCSVLATVGKSLFELC